MVVEVIFLWRLFRIVYIWLLHLLLFLEIRHDWFHANLLFLRLYGLCLLRHISGTWKCGFPCLIALCSLPVCGHKMRLAVFRL
ncbi:hypothetical protein L6452_13636 [Arctium lappa]|uniref:Uncharacterized protein n=1 Tax=Arctium lappa TaxID=4217 RepID=A0ACB9CJ55_ARCLA|nr:hypothetical protein L6452_13636 [Arctium lappa]